MTIDEIYSLGSTISVLMDGYVQKDELISLRGTLVPATTVNKAVMWFNPFVGRYTCRKKGWRRCFWCKF